MDITPETTVHALLKEYPPLLDFLTDYHPSLRKLSNPALRQVMGRTATLERVSEIADVPLNRLIIDLEAEIVRQAGTDPVDSKMDSQERINILAAIIRDLHAGHATEELTARFSELLSTVDAGEVAAMEQQLMDEGMPLEEVMRLCDVHVQVISDGLASDDATGLAPGHPANTFRRENEAIAVAVEALKTAVAAVSISRDSDAVESLESTLRNLRPILLHYDRKENVLFPFLEKAGYSGPSQVMWGIDDEIRADLAAAQSAVELGEIDAAVETSIRLAQAVEDMITKEERILLPLALEALTREHWIEIRRGERADGYAYLDSVPEWPTELPPRPAFVSVERLMESVHPADPGVLQLETGSLTVEQLNLMLNTMKMDLNFVDENDEVRFFSEGERIFGRSASVIGRKVQQCHPPSSVHKVQEILDAFRAGEKDIADFWIQLHGRFIHIRYLAVRDAEGAYRGTIESVQDVTEIRKLEGERRLIDW